MLYLLEVTLAKPAEMSRSAFYGLVQRESEKAAEFLASGELRAAYKVAGADAIVAILDIESNDRIDTLTQELPIWAEDFHHLAKVRWTPLREYAAWYDQVRTLAAGPEAPAASVD